MTTQLSPSNQNACFHCGLPVPQDVHLPIVYEEHEQATCCAGCQAVAQSIIAAGLGNYYKQRTADAERVALPPPEMLERLNLYDLPEVQADFVFTSSAQHNQREAVLMLGGITCAACVWLIEQQLMRLKGVLRADLNYSTQRVRVLWNQELIQLSDILLTIHKTGYSAAPYDAQKVEEQAQKERKKSIVRLAVAGLSMMQTMMFAMPTYLHDDIEEPFLSILHWGVFIMALPVLLYAALPFYQGFVRDWRNRRAGMDTPITLAIVMTTVAGLYALYSEAGQGMYFEGLAMLVFFLLLGRFMEQDARRKAGSAAEKLVKLIPAFCHQLRHYPESEESEEAAVVKLQRDDVIVVRAGEIIPADGMVLAGESAVNEAMLTGENLPISKQTGDAVIAGTLNTESRLIVRVEATQHNTRLAHIVQLLDRALSQKPRLALLADKYASSFILGSILLAVPVFLAWWWYADVLQALWITVSLLVITCPCALSLATPTSLAASTGKLAEQGILIAGASALENLAKIQDIVFDKTGTLTQGNLVVEDAYFAEPLSPQLAVHIAQVLEQHSEHPIAQAILAMEYESDTSNAIHIVNKQNHIGFGVEAELNIQGQNQVWRIGRPAFVQEIAGEMPSAWQHLNEHRTLITLGSNTGFAALFLLNDQIKEGVPTLLATLKEQGFQLHILSGDNSNTVAHLAQQLGIQHYQAEATPEDKLAYVTQLQAQGKAVLMLGDGINDAPVLAASDVSIAMAGGADIAREGSDVVLLNEDMNAVNILLQQAKRTAMIIKENLIWASAYNLIAVPLAAAGLVTPWVAALGMSLSSFVVLLNALRLRR